MVHHFISIQICLGKDRGFRQISEAFKTVAMSAWSMTIRHFYPSTPKLFNKPTACLVLGASNFMFSIIIIFPLLSFVRKGLRQSLLAHFLRQFQGIITRLRSMGNTAAHELNRPDGSLARVTRSFLLKGLLTTTGNFSLAFRLDRSQTLIGQMGRHTSPQMMRYVALTRNMFSGKST